MTTAGEIFFFLFVWHVFRRESIPAKAVVVAATAVMLLTLVFDTLIAGEMYGPPPYGPPPGSPTTLAAADLVQRMTELSDLQAVVKDSSDDRAGHDPSTQRDDSYRRRSVRRWPDDARTDEWRPPAGMSRRSP